MDYKSKYLKYKKKYLELKKKSNKQFGGSVKNFNIVFPNDKNRERLNELKKYLLDERGWKSQGYDFTEVDDIKNADIQVYFKTNDELKKIVNYNKNLMNLSITDYSTTPTTIYFNIENWNNPPKEFKEKNNRLSTYRAYLVQHEFGHAIGFGHEKRPEKSENMKSCPVMLQQSKYTEPYCLANPWIKKLI